MKQQMALGALNGHVAEMYGGHTIVTAFGHEQKSVATFDDAERAATTTARGGRSSSAASSCRR